MSKSTPLAFVSYTTKAIKHARCYPKSGISVVQTICRSWQKLLHSSEKALIIQRVVGEGPRGQPTLAETIMARTIKAALHPCATMERQSLKRVLGIGKGHLWYLAEFQNSVSSPEYRCFGKTTVPQKQWVGTLPGTVLLRRPALFPTKAAERCLPVSGGNETSFA